MDDRPQLHELPGLLAAELIQIGPALNSVSRAIVTGILDDAIARADALAAEVAALRAELDVAPIQFIDGSGYRLIPVGVTAGIWQPAPPQE